MTHENFPENGIIGISPAYTIVNETTVNDVHTREVLLDGEYVKFETLVETENEMRLWLDAQIDEGEK